MKLRTRPELLKLVVSYLFYSVIIRSFCPFCLYRATHKTKCYHSLKSLGHHIATEHKDSSLYPFSVHQVTEIIKVIAKALELGILPYEESTSRKNRSIVFPRVKRFFDEDNSQ